MLKLLKGGGRGHVVAGAAVFLVFTTPGQMYCARSALIRVRSLRLLSADHIGGMFLAF